MHSGSPAQASSARRGRAGLGREGDEAAGEAPGHRAREAGGGQAEGGGGSAVRRGGGVEGRAGRRGQGRGGAPGEGAGGGGARREALVGPHGGGEGDAGAGELRELRCDGALPRLLGARPPRGAVPLQGPGRGGEGPRVRPQGVRVCEVRGLRSGHPRPARRGQRPLHRLRRRRQVLHGLLRQAAPQANNGVPAPPERAPRGDKPVGVGADVPGVAGFGKARALPAWRGGR
mmetsp:Transcript_14543/g.39823  ORF Transcript_14543/g.39823 Transcript_14543/m.39823 type:complete len:231 (+) Transcript_14543:265-957(+)